MEWIVPEATQPPPPEQGSRPISSINSAAVPYSHEIWDSTTIRRVRWNSEADDRRLHIPNKIYCLSQNLRIEKLVVKRGAGLRPLRGHIIRVAHQALIQEEHARDDSELEHYCELVLWNAESDRCHISNVISSMAKGERCVVRTETYPENDSTTLPRFRIDVFHCIDIWKEQTVSVSPPLILQTSANALPPISDLRDSIATLHFQLFKRGAGRPPDFNCSSDEWTFVMDTRNNGDPMVLVLGQGRHLPCLEIMLASSHEKNTRLFSSHCFGMGPYYLTQLNNQLEFEALELDPFYETCQLENCDILFTDVEVLGILPPPYESSDTKAEQLHKLGNDFLKRKSYRRALMRYSDGLAALGVKNLGPSTPHEVRDRCKALVLNSVLCYMSDSLQRWDLALEGIAQIMRIDPENSKALARKARCLRYRNKDGDMEEALKCITSALMKEPNDKEMKDEKRLIIRRIEENSCPFKGLRRSHPDGWFSNNGDSQESNGGQSELENRMPFDLFRHCVRHYPSQ